MDCPLQIADPFPVNDADFQNPLTAAFVQIIRDKAANFSRFERVQIQHAVNWK